MIIKVYKITLSRIVKGYEEPDALEFVSSQFTRDEVLVKCLGNKKLGQNLYVECEEMWLEDNENE